MVFDAVVSNCGCDTLREIDMEDVAMGNRLKTLGALGRPRKIKSPLEFDTLVDAYVAVCMEEEEPLTVTGCALYMGFCDKSSFFDYGKKKGFEEFTHSVKRARMIIEAGYERSAANGGGAGPIFLLKASYGYKDVQHVEVAPITVNIEGKDAQL